jgi:Icc-related predicted phosphoesterase
MISITLISDTHGYHNDLQLKGGDILIHAGDISMRGDNKECADFMWWLRKQPYKHIVFVCGNHDWLGERDPSAFRDLFNVCCGDNVHYLEDQYVELEGLKIWGSPITPEFHAWAFNRERGYQIRKYWQQIPEDTDILVTHGPPAGVLDFCSGGHVGCDDLFQRVMEVQPIMHVFGHIHEGYGVQELGSTTCYNASVLDGRYRQVNQPHYLEL